MTKTYKRDDERAKFRIVSEGCAMDFQTEGSVIAGIVTCFEFLPAIRRQRLLDALARSSDKLLASESQRAAAQSNPSPNES